MQDLATLIETMVEDMKQEIDLQAEKIARLHGRIRRLEARVTPLEKNGLKLRLTDLPLENDDHD